MRLVWNQRVDSVGSPCSYVATTKTQVPRSSWREVGGRRGMIGLLRRMSGRGDKGADRTYRQLLDIVARQRRHGDLCGPLLLCSCCQLLGERLRRTRWREGGLR